MINFLFFPPTLKLIPIYSKASLIGRNINPAVLSDLAIFAGFIIAFCSSNKLCILCIFSTEDEKIELNPDINSDSDYLLPPQIKTTYKQLQIFLFKGEHFPDMENTFGKERTTNKRCIGYIEVKYLGISKSTQIKEMKNDIIH